MVERHIDRQAVGSEMDRARACFRPSLSEASPADLRRASAGTRWTNQQLLFHMAFGYFVVRTLLRLVRVFGRLPDWSSELFARVLDAGTRPFHVVNYLGSCGGALVFHGDRLTKKLDRTITALHRRLDHETAKALRRTIQLPVHWDPFFRERMTLLDVYHFATQHFEFHQWQLTLAKPDPHGEGTS